MPQDRLFNRDRVTIALEVNKKLDRSTRQQLLHGIQELEWRAIEETLLEEIETVTQYATDAGIAKDHGSLAHYAGGLAALRLLIANLEDSRADGGKTS